jgi:hypothetical protein
MRLFGLPYARQEAPVQRGQETIMDGPLMRQKSRFFHPLLTSVWN